jgi:methylated-DNA-[protein]-cysteine S-methyltransferase
MTYQDMESPIGTLRLVANGTHLQAIKFAHQFEGDDPSDNRGDSVLSLCAEQLTEYFAGARQRFYLPLDAHGTAFQLAVWKSLAAIPYGEVRSYKEIALAIDNVKAVRAVGAANGRNPLPIVLPCHRVIGSDGSLTGYAGGLERKTFLLQLEGALMV